jgi:hypothetical protein
MYEDEYLDAAYEDRTCGPEMEDDYNDQDDYEEEREDYDAELDHDILLERQELEDFENFYGPCGYDDGGGEW